NIPYTSYSKITKPNSVHQCDLIEMPYNEDVDTSLLDNGPIFYYVLLAWLLQCDQGYEFMESMTLIIDEHNVNIRKTKARFRHTSLAMVDHYAGLFELRVFKNQYAIEFLLPTSERYKECERFARRIVNNMNDTPTRIMPSFPNHNKFVHLDSFALAGEKKARFDNADYHYIRRPSLAPHYTHLDVILLRI
ncbi:14121_t:CDS:2, partial [Dentiscutata erythropus]